MLSLQEAVIEKLGDRMGFARSYAGNVVPLSIIKSAFDKSARSAGFWFGLSGIVVLLTIMAPFGTGDLLGLEERIVYWALVSVSCYFTTLLVVAPFHIFWRRVGLDWRLSCLISGAISGIPCFLLVSFINNALFTVGVGTLETYANLFFVSVLTAVIGTTLHMVIVDEFRDPEADRSQEREYVGASRLLDRLDPSVSGPLVSMQAQGHYIEVTTLRGKQLLLMRFGSAVQEIAPQQGRQVHRSWWVAQSAVSSVKRVNGRPQLTLKNGAIVPVSKFNLSQIKAWLDLHPRG